MSTYTQRKRFEKQDALSNENTWGGYLNVNTTDLIDECFGLVCVAFSNASDVTLTANSGLPDEGRRSQIVLTGAPTSNVRLFVPAVQSFYLVRNKMTGSYKVTLTNTGGTNGVDFSGSGSGAEQGTVISDGTNVRAIFRTVSVGALNLFPPGIIIPFFNSVGAIPSRWVLCDGTNNTPNLNDRFILGTTSNSNVDTSGGGLNITVVSAGEHTHTITSTTLTSAHIPAHRHGMFVSATASSGEFLTNSTQKVPWQGAFYGTAQFWYAMSHDTYEGAETNWGGQTNFAYTSSPDSHTHVLTSTNLHSHSVSAGQARPPFHRLLFIKFTG